MISLVGLRCLNEGSFFRVFFMGKVINYLRDIRNFVGKNV